jgi:hypothetical protein
MSTRLRHNLVHWASREVEAQGDSYYDIVPLVDAYLYLEKRLAGSKRQSGMNAHTLLHAGAYAKPSVNRTEHFRKVQVAVGMHIPPVWYQVPRQIDKLCEAWQEGRMVDPTEWFIEFELIHPYVDGNGRIGAAVANILMDNADTELLLSYEIHSFNP